MAIEQDHIVVHHVTFNDIPTPEILGDFRSVSVFENVSLFCPVFLFPLDKIGSGMDISTVYDQLAHQLQIGRMNLFGVGQDFGNVNGDTDLLDSQIGIGRNDSSTRKVDTFTAQVATESTLFTFESLDKTPERTKNISLLNL